MRRILVLASAALALLVAAPASAHQGTSGTTETPQVQPQRTKGGPCTKAASKGMPSGEGHDHSKISQHRLRCRMRQVFFDSLLDELAARKDVVLGEMDVKKGLAIVSVTFPEAGFLLFDVRKPARPKFLSWYRTTECDQLYADINCGAFVDLSARGDVAFLSIQTLTLASGRVPRPEVDPAALPSVEVVDIRDRHNPRRLYTYPVLSEGGVHTTRSHVIPENKRDEGPRDAGEYLFSIGNGHGIDVAEVVREGDEVYLDFVNYLYIGETHDTYIQNDPIDGRTYLYVAGGRAAGFEVYDVTDPGVITPIARWDLTPECYDDWYAHTIDVAYKGKRRYVTLPVEINDGGERPEEEHATCGKSYGNPDKAGPMWIVDASDWSKLGKIAFTGEGESDDEETLAAKSRDTLVATWTNPAGKAGGNMVFSPHNQQIVGNRIYLSSFHGGVFVLDASAAFSGKKKTPTELGFIVPSGDGERPFFETTLPPVQRFFTARHGVRPDIWDAYWYKGYIFAADMVGGFYSLQYDGDRPKKKKKKRKRRR